VTDNRSIPGPSVRVFPRSTSIEKEKEKEIENEKAERLRDFDCDTACAEYSAYVMFSPAFVGVLVAHSSPYPDAKVTH